MSDNKGRKNNFIDFMKKAENWWIIIGVLVIGVAITTPFAVLHKLGWNFTYSQFEKLGVVGDFFGGTTVGLFTLASILFVIAAIVMQKKELALQREELSQTREEFKTGNITAKVQQIDNAFFNMLSLHHQIVNNITITESDKTYSGRKAIEKLKGIYQRGFASNQFFIENPQKSFKDWLKEQYQYIESLFGTENRITQEALDLYYKNFHDKYGNDIGHYMRNNYRIVKFIINNVADDVEEQKKIKDETGREPIIGDRRYYLGMLRAQWSNAEFELILFNSLYKKNNKFKNLILKYDVLDIEDKENYPNSEIFKLKESMDKFKAYKKLIEVEK